MRCSDSRTQSRRARTGESVVLYSLRTIANQHSAANACAQQAHSGHERRRGQAVDARVSPQGRQGRCNTGLLLEALTVSDCRGLQSSAPSLSARLHFNRQSARMLTRPSRRKCQNARFLALRRSSRLTRSLAAFPTLFKVILFILFILAGLSVVLGRCWPWCTAAEYDRRRVSSAVARDGERQVVHRGHSRGGHSPQSTAYPDGSLDVSGHGRYDGRHH